MTFPGMGSAYESPRVRCRRLIRSEKRARLAVIVASARVGEAAGWRFVSCGRACRLQRLKTRRSLIAVNMGYDLRPMSANDIDPVLLALREEIAAADRDLLAAFTRRLDIAVRIRGHKNDRGYATVDLEREQQLLEDWRKTNNGVISDEALLELFETVLRLSKSEAARER